MIRFRGGVWLRTNVLNLGRFPPNIFGFLSPKSGGKRYHFLARRNRNPLPNGIGSLLFSSYDSIGWGRIIILQPMIRFCGGIGLRTNVLNFDGVPPNIRVLVSKTPKMLQSWRETISLPGSQSLKNHTELVRTGFIFKLWLYGLD